MATDSKVLSIESSTSDNIELSIKNEANFMQLSETIIQSFLKYDSCNPGILTHDEFMGFINQLRMSLYLSKADDETFTIMIQILDPENTNEITKHAIEEKLSKIIE